MNSRPEQIRKAVEGSLMRLGVETIDLLYQHRVDPKVPIEDVAGTGTSSWRVKPGFSDFLKPGLTTIRRAHAVHPVAALQSEYSLWTRQHEQEIIRQLKSWNRFSGIQPTWQRLFNWKIDENRKFEPGDIRAVIPRFSEGCPHCQ